MEVVNPREAFPLYEYIGGGEDDYQTDHGSIINPGNLEEEVFYRKVRANSEQPQYDRDVPHFGDGFPLKG